MRVVSWIVALLLVFANAAYAQNTGQIFGKVTDNSGGVLPGVTVTISSSVLLEPRVAVTSPEGSYAVPGLPIGTYKVTFTLNGFATLIMDSIAVRASFSATVNAQMKLGGVAENIVVTGASPLIDAKSTTQGEHFGVDQLDALPTGRDVFSFFQKSPSILVAGQGVGGSTLGTQNGFISRGAAVGQIRTFSDGVDASPGNNQPFYFDFDAMQELEIKTGGADVTMQTSGTVINLLSKSGTDRFKGTARTYITDQRFESDNITDALRKQGASSGNPILNVKDFGTEIGGPMVKGRLWYWGALSKQTTSNAVIGFYKTSADCQAIAANPLGSPVADVRNCLNPATVDLEHVNYKVSLKPFKNNLFELRNSYDLKTAVNRGASSLVAPSATTRLLAVNDTAYGPKFWTTGWPALWHFGDQHTFTDRWLINVSYGRFCGCTNTALSDDSLANVQPKTEVSTGSTTRSAASAITFPVKNRFEATSTYFLPDMLGADHTFKVGFSDLYQWQISAGHTGGNAIAQYSSGALPAFSTPFSAQFTRDNIQRQNFKQQSVWLQDTISRHRLTVILGLRWDRQSDTQGASVLPASPFQGAITRTGTVFNFLPAVNFPGVSGLPVWNTVAPRIGLTFDLTGDGKNLIKASLSQYYDQRGIGQLSATLSTIGAATVTFPWADLNGDGFVQANEVTTTTILSFGGGYNPANPAQTVSPNSVDPGIKDPRTDEVVVGFSKQLTSTTDFSVTYIWRNYSNYIWQARNGLSSANYTPVVFTPAASACPAGSNCQTVTYYVPNITLPSPFTLANQPDYSQRYQGLEFSARKRFSHGLTLMGSFALNSTLAFYNSAASYQDPTNISTLSGAQYAPLVSNSGGASSNPNAKWIARANGSYRIPWHDIGVSAALDTRQGYPNQQTINIASRPNSAGAIQVLLAPPGSVRLPSFAQLDVRVDKPFTVGRTTVTATMDVFNALNAPTILGVNTIQNATTANLVTQILAPRVARLGINIKF